MSREYPTAPLVGLGVVVLRPAGGHGPEAVLLVRRARAPAMGQWSIPGGVQELGETAEAGARRELREETGLEAGLLVLAAHVDSIHRDGEGRVQFHYTILDFAALWTGSEPVGADDVSEARFFACADLAGMGVWSETLRVVDAARAVLGLERPGPGGACGVSQLPPLPRT